MRAPRPSRSWPSSSAFSIAIRTASTRLIWPAPIPIVRRSLAITIAFEVTCLQTRQAKSMSPQAGSSGLAADDDHPLAVLDVGVAVLREQAAEHAPVVALAGVRARRSVESRIRSASFARSVVERLLVVARREQHLDELLGEPLGEHGRHRPVDDDHAAVRRDRIGAERARVRLLDRAGDGDAARVRVLDDHAGRERELLAELPRGREVVEVVVRELLAR